MRFFFKSLKFSDISQNLISAFLLSFIFTSPFLIPVLTGGFQNFLVGDQLILTFPQFVYGAQLFKEGIFSGVDFLTSSGGTDFFLRANLPGRYPIFDFFYAINKLYSFENLELIYIVIFSIHLFIGGFFLIKLGREVFKLSLLMSILWCILSIYCSIRFLYSPFLFITTLYPCVIYILYYNLSKSNVFSIFRSLLQSFPFVLVFLAGYMPLSIMCILCAIIGSLLIYFERNDNPNLIVIIKSWVPLAIATIVVFPLYLAILKYYDSNSVAPKSLFFSAHDLVGLPSDFFSMVSYSIHIPRSEGGSVILGLMPFVILVLGLFSKSKSAPYKANYFIWFGSFLFGFIWVVNLGKESGLSDLFYYLIPSLGKMHIYSRFLPFALLPFSLLVIKSLMAILDGFSRYILKITFIIFIVIVFSLSMALSLGEGGDLNLKIDFQKLLLECLAVIFLLYAIISQNKRSAVVVAIITTFGFSAGYVYIFSNSAVDFPWQSAKEKQVYFNKNLNASLIDYIKEYSGHKSLVKYLDLSDKPTTDALMRNYPWLVRKDIKISNYIGYELHVGRYKENNILNPFYGLQNIGYVIRSGVDFLVIDKEIMEKFSSLVDNIVDDNIPPFYLGEGRYIQKVKKVIPADQPFYRVEFTAWSNGISTIEASVNGIAKKSLYLDFHRKVFSIDVDDVALNKIKINFIKKGKSNLYIQNFSVTKFYYNSLKKNIPISNIEYVDGFSKGKFINGSLYTTLSKKAGALKFNITDLDFDVPLSNFNFNNGVISASLDDVDDKINDFRTNYFGNVSFSIFSKRGAYVQLNTFYSRNYVLTIDGKITTPTIIDGLGGIEVLPGNHKIKIEYRNRLHKVFNYLYFSYFSILCFALFLLLIRGVTHKLKNIYFYYRQNM